MKKRKRTVGVMRREYVYALAALMSLGVISPTAKSKFDRR
jgi:hypothetical protein